MNFVAVSLRLYLTVLLGLVAIIGDSIVSHSKIQIFQAIFDNATHSIIGGLSWFLVCVCSKKYNSGVIVEVALCALIASLIDLDHFVVAKSLKLQDATNLKGRPPLHCSTLPLILCVFLFLISYVIQNNFVLHACLIIFTAFTSHHTRDATRRGYWFYPFGSTAPIPYVFYVTFTCILPYLIFILYKYLKIPYSNNNSSIV